MVAVKTILADMPPILFAFVRFGSAFLVLLAILRWREGSVGLPRADIVPMLLLGLAGFGLYQDLWATALANVVMFETVKVLGPTRTMLFQFLVPAFAVVLASLFLGESIVAGQIGGGVIIVIGILIARTRRLGARQL